MAGNPPVPVARTHRTGSPGAALRTGPQERLPAGGTRGTAGGQKEGDVPELDQESLHQSLQEPVLGSIEFVKEITARFPDAISFALGAPHPAHLDQLDISRYVDRYVEHLSRERGLGPQRARRLLYEYGPSRGLINDLVAAGLRRDQGVEVPPAAVVITVGAQEAMLLALRAVCSSPDDLLAVVDPSFYGIIGAARVLDVGLVPVRDGDHGIDIDDLESACCAARAEGRRIRALYVAPDFANPSGTVMDLATRRQLFVVAERHDLLLLEDNAYGFTAAPRTELPTLKSMDEGGRVIYIGTFAKVCLPGARVGFVVADQIVNPVDGARRLLGDELALIKSMTTVNTSPLCQAIIGGMVLEQGGSLAALGDENSQTYQRNLGLLLDALDRHVPPMDGLTWNRPEGGFFVRMRIPVPADNALLEISASKYGVVWTPLSTFYLGCHGAHHLRLSCSYLDPQEIEVGVLRLARFLHDLPRQDRRAPNGSHRPGLSRPATTRLRNPAHRRSQGELLPRRPE